MGLRKPTVWYRKTLNTEGVLIVPAETNMPETAVRRVTLFLRENPECEFALDVDPTSAGDRDAYWPELDGSNIGKVPLKLLAHQTLVGRSTGAIHELSVIVEYEE